MAAGTRGTGGLSGRRITDGRRRRTSGRLRRIVLRNVIELGRGHPREECLHELMLAFTPDVVLHRPNEVLRAQPGEARHARQLADPSFAMTSRAGDDLAA